MALWCLAPGGNNQNSFPAQSQPPARIQLPVSIIIYRFVNAPFKYAGYGVSDIEVVDS